MAEWKRAPWRKLHRQAVSSSSHVGIGANARALLLTLIAEAWWDEESSEGRLLESSDPADAMSIERLGRLSDLTPGQARTALERLIRKETAAVVEGGVVTLPNFRKWQRSESYERVKKHREKRDGNGYRNVEADSRQQTADQQPPVGGLGAGLDSKPKRPRKPPAQLDAQAELVLARIDEHRERWGIPKIRPSARTDRTILARLRAGATVDELLAGVEARARKADRDVGDRESLNATTPFTGPTGDRPGGWSFTCQLLDRERATSSSRSPSTETPEQAESRRRYEAERDKARAEDREKQRQRDLALRPRREGEVPGGA